MQSSLHDGLDRRPLPPPLAIPPSFTSSHTSAPEQLQSPQSPAEFRKRSLVHPSPHQLSKGHVMTPSIEKKSPSEENLQTQLPPPPAYPGAPLSLFKTYFCKPVSSDPEKQHDPENRKFSFFSVGSIVSAAIMLFLLLTTILAPVLAGTFDHRNRTRPGRNGGTGITTGGGGNVGNPTGGFNSATGSYVDLAINTNFADPFIIQWQGMWYAFATNNAVGLIDAPKNVTDYKFDRSNIQIATSSDFQNWNLLPDSQDPLPDVGSWSIRGDRKDLPGVPRAAVWAPAVFQRPGDGKFLLYYSAASSQRGFTHCIGAAVSNTNSPAGPYTPLQQSFACPIAAGGAIDPAPFIDNGTIYIAYKVDGNNRGSGGSCGNTKQPQKNTPIMLQKMDGNGLVPVGDPVTILDRTAADGPLVEAPSLIKSPDGLYFLFFSSGCTRDPSYNIKYAWSYNITGPYTRASSALLRTGDAGLLAPGSCTVAQASDGSYSMAFHGRIHTKFGGLRAMFTTGVIFNGTSVLLSTD